MNWYKYLCEKVTEGIESNITIAMLAITYWIINASGMSDEHLTDIMTRLSFVFNLSTQTLTAEGIEYTIYGLLDYCVTEVYPNEITLNDTGLKCVIQKCEGYGYITAEERAILEGKF